MRKQKTLSFEEAQAKLAQVKTQFTAAVDEYNQKAAKHNTAPQPETYAELLELKRSIKFLRREARRVAKLTTEAGQAAQAEREQRRELRKEELAQTRKRNEEVSWDDAHKANYVFASDVKKEYGISNTALLKQAAEMHAADLTRLGLEDTYCPCNCDGSDWNAHTKELERGAKCICQVKDDFPFSLLPGTFYGRKTYSREMVEKVVRAVRQ